MGFTINLTSFREFVNRVESAPSVESPGPIQDAALSASNIYHTAMRERYREASNRDGTWVELAESTQAEHKSFGDDPAHILHGRTGELQASLNRGHPDHVLELNDKSVVEGTQNFVARFQHSGTDKIPPREILVYPDNETLERMKIAIGGPVQTLLTGRNELLASTNLEELFGIEFDRT